MTLYRNNSYHINIYIYINIHVCIYTYICECMFLLYMHIYIHIYIYTYIYMVVDQNSFIPERPFFANKHFTFANSMFIFSGAHVGQENLLWRFVHTCQITPENHGSLLGSLLNMQLASRNPFSGQIFFGKVYWPTPFNMHFDFRPLFRITFAELSRTYPYSQTPAISRVCTEGKAKTRGLGVWLSQSLTFGNLAAATRILWCPSPAGPRAAVGGSPLHIPRDSSGIKILMLV